MPHFITVPNRDHPAYRIKALLTQLKRLYQAQSTEKLRAIIAREAPAITELGTLKHRHQLIRFLLEAGELEFKRAWEKENGWPFDDVYDPAKYRAHLEQARKDHVSEQAPIIQAAAAAH